MPPPLALALTIGFVAFLYIRGFRAEGKASPVLWLPVLWIMITGTRFVSQWINIAAPIEITGGAEGSPLDAAVFAALILAGTVVVLQRSVIARFTRENPWLVLFIIYSLVSVAWSDFPSIALKRWIKTLGHPIMALIILTDPRPMNALRIVMKRCAFVLIPFSITLIKYYPEYGRGFDGWTGEGYSNGVAINKNGLGCLCMIFGIFFLWTLLTRKSAANPRAKREELIVSCGLLGMIGWLLWRADSSTSLAAFVVGSATMVVLGSSKTNKRMLGFYILAGFIAFALAETNFGLTSEIIRLLGRDPTLTDRTLVWHDALALQPNPVLGAGFESFWLGERLDVMWAKWKWRPNQAHNGYIETYLNLGLVGIVLLALVIAATYRNIANQFLTNPDFARLRLAFLIAILAYNITEATFKGVHVIWTVFFIIAIDSHRLRVPAPAPIKAARAARTAVAGQSGALAKRSPASNERASHP